MKILRHHASLYISAASEADLLKDGVEKPDIRNPAASQAEDNN